MKFIALILLPLSCYYVPFYFMVNLNSITNYFRLQKRGQTYWSRSQLLFSSSEAVLIFLHSWILPGIHSIQNWKIYSNFLAPMIMLFPVSSSCRMLGLCVITLTLIFHNLWDSFILFQPFFKFNFVVYSYLEISPKFLSAVNKCIFEVGY